MVGKEGKWAALDERPEMAHRSEGAEQLAIVGGPFLLVFFQLGAVE